MSIHTVTTRQLSERNGKPRLWIEGQRLKASGFEPSAMFVIEPHQQGIVLKLVELGTNKVSRRERKEGRHFWRPSHFLYLWPQLQQRFGLTTDQDWHTLHYFC